MAFNNFFTTNLGKDICMAYKMPNGIDRFFHIRNGKNDVKLLMETNPEDPIMVSRINGDNDYWLFSTYSEQPKMVLYDYRLGIVTTSFFDHLEVIKDSNKHRFYFEKNLIGTYENEEIFFTTLCGFLDKGCNLSSDIFDIESKDKLYDANMYRNTMTKEFQSLCLLLIRNYIDKYQEDELHNNEIINSLYDNPVELTEIKETKIYKFDRKKV